jgi:hypothetical protein
MVHSIRKKPLLKIYYFFICRFDATVFSRGLEDFRLEAAEHDNDHSALGEEIYNVVRDFYCNNNNPLPN